MRVLFGKICCVFCSAFLLVVAGQAFAGEANTVSELLLQASSAYKEGRYAESVKMYEDIAAAGVNSGKLYYNLGNAYMRTGRPGHALLNYRRAELRMPRDDALRSNIQYVLSQARDNIDCQGYAATLRDVCFWYTRMSSNEIFWSAVAFNALFWMLLLVRYFYRREGLTIVLAIVLFISAIFCASAAVKHYSVAFMPHGVVVVPEMLVRSGTSFNDTVLFKLHEAAECIVEEERDQWVLISLCDGKKGWVQASSISKVE